MSQPIASREFTLQILASVSTFRPVIRYLETTGESIPPRAVGGPGAVDRASMSVSIESAFALATRALNTAIRVGPLLLGWCSAHVSVWTGSGPVEVLVAYFGANDIALRRMAWRGVDSKMRTAHCRRQRPQRPARVGCSILFAFSVPGVLSYLLFADSGLPYNAADFLKQVASPCIRTAGIVGMRCCYGKKPNSV